jgi:hypothetical protein
MNLNFKIGNIASLFTVLFGLHIYFSYVLIKEYLKSKGLEAFPILTPEDVVFPYGLITSDLFVLIFSGFIFSLLMEPIIYNDNFSEWIMNKLKKNNRRDFKPNFIKFFLLGVTLIFVLIVVHIITGLLNTAIEWVMFITVFVIPALLIFLPKHKITLTGLQFVLIFIWLNLFVSSVISSKKNNWSTEIVSFEFSGEQFITGIKGLNLVFYGYKNVVIQDENSGKMLIFPTEKLQDLTLARKVK